MATATTTKSRRSGRRRFSSSGPPTRSRRRRKWLIASAALLMLVAWCAPTIVAKTSLLDWALNRAAADLNGRLSRQFIENAAYNVIQDEVSRGLQKLFGPQ